MAPLKPNTRAALCCKTYPNSSKGLTYPGVGRSTWRPVSPSRLPRASTGALPMPMSLDHINLWLLADGDGWTVVDTCLNLDSARQLGEHVFGSVMAGRPITRVICTHMHPDHVGLAGWLTERFGAELWMSRRSS